MALSEIFPMDTLAAQEEISPMDANTNTLCQTKGTIGDFLNGREVTRVTQNAREMRRKTGLKIQKGAQQSARGK